MSLYSDTGVAKIPALVKYLKNQLNDPMSGKMCIFAHHLAVLDGIEEGALNGKSYIRIDGSVSPKQRQAAIVKFQTDPNCRVALLGITAAGVAVTLTASSHVLFTELFWTPAMLLQAEDRCHRIGQQNTVNVSYFILRNSLDEVLWELTRRKFEILGEFVEGIKNLEMRVHKKKTNDGEGNTMDIDNNSDDDEEDDKGGIVQIISQDVENLGNVATRFLPNNDDNNNNNNNDEGEGDNEGDNGWGDDEEGAVVVSRTNSSSSSSSSSRGGSRQPTPTPIPTPIPRNDNNDNPTAAAPAQTVAQTVGGGLENNDIIEIDSSQQINSGEDVIVEIDSSSEDDEELLELHSQQEVLDKLKPETKPETKPEPKKKKFKPSYSHEFSDDKLGITCQQLGGQTALLVVKDVQQIGVIQVDDVLVQVGTTTIIGWTLREAENLIKKSERPLSLGFVRASEIEESGTREAYLRQKKLYDHSVIRIDTSSSESENSDTEEEEEEGMMGGERTTTRCKIVGKAE